MFPLPLEDIYKALFPEGRQKVRLPRLAEDMANVVRVILKSCKPEVAKAIALTRVRRFVVVSLISELKDRGHPSYLHLDMEDVLRRSEDLPEDGMLPLLCSTVGNDKASELLVPPKNSTPDRARSQSAQEAFDGIRSSHKLGKMFLGSRS